MTQPSAVRPHDFVSTGKRIAFIQASWHADIVDQARIGFVAQLGRLGVPETVVDTIQTPGAFEIPLQAQRLIGSSKYAAVVAAGFVIDGGIYRHEFVAETVVSALMRVQLDTGVPVFSVVLTPHHFHEHATHHDFFFDHFRKKGEEAARACMQVLELMADGIVEVI